MTSFKIKGGNRLGGEIEPQGAKNEALQILSATLLTEEPVTIHKVPNIRDVNKLIDLLKLMGVEVEKLGSESYRFMAKNVDLSILETEEYKAMASSLRGSIMVLGPLLARFGKGKIIGKRPESFGKGKQQGFNLHCPCTI